VRSSLGIDAQEVERGQQHPRGAEPALQSVMLVEGLLERMELAVLRQPLHGRQLGAVGLHGQHQARPRGLPVDEDRAGPADAVLAPDVGPREPEVLADEVDEQLAGRAAALPRGAVDGELDGRDVAAIHGWPS
jgi:hypothetical protein